MYLKYAWYLVRHKYFVFLECCKLGIPFLGLIHDLSKLPWAEFPSSARKFRGMGKQRENAGEPYEHAWLHHQRHNKHHWAYWVVYIPTSGLYSEPFAAQEHDSWSRWMKHLFEKSHLREDGYVSIPPRLVRRWKRQMSTQFFDLPDDEKESDRDEARKFLALFDQAKLCLPMPSCYRREMLADMRGAGRALGKPDILAWYMENHENMLLHPDTRKWLEEQLRV